jgi:hypothetical protein
VIWRNGWTGFSRCEPDKPVTIPLPPKEQDPRTGRRRNLGTFGTRAAAEKHEKAVQFFKRRG